MRTAVYNPVISNVILNTVKRASHFAFRLRVSLCFLLLIPCYVIRALAADWSVPEQQLARKIVAETGPGAVTLTVENRSSLSRRESEIVSDGLHSALERLGLRFVKPEQAAATVAISLSENPNAYVWVAEIRQGDGKVSIEMVSSPHIDGVVSAHDTLPLSIRKIPVWTQEERILDVLVTSTSRIRSSCVQTGILRILSGNVSCAETTPSMCGEETISIETLPSPCRISATQTYAFGFSESEIATVAAACSGFTKRRPSLSRAECSPSLTISLSRLLSEDRFSTVNVTAPGPVFATIFRASCCSGTLQSAARARLTKQGIRSKKHRLTRRRNAKCEARFTVFRMTFEITGL